MKGKLIMTNLEFVLSASNININNVSEAEIKFIDETLIPMYAFSALLSSTTHICHPETGEVREIDVKEMFENLKDFLNNL